MIERAKAAADMFLTHEIERDTLACDLTPDELRSLARAVLQAMREPTPGMVSAYEAQLYGDESFSFSGYQAMIDAALAEREAG